VRDIRRKVLHRRFRPEIPALEIELHFDGRQSRVLAYEMDGHGNQGGPKPGESAKVIAIR